MSKILENKIAVKQALSDKYARLAIVAGSAVKRSTWMYHSNRFRNQVRVLKEALKQDQERRAQ